jgi:hypothetical protein
MCAGAGYFPPYPVLACQLLVLWGANLWAQPVGMEGRTALSMVLYAVASR